MMLKKAETDLYNFNKETGEDVINTAHPEGSNDVGLGPDAEVETQLDQQRKILDVIRKQPKGKLASKTAISAVKLILAQQQPTAPVDSEKTVESAQASALKYVEVIFKIWEQIDELVKKDGLDQYSTGFKLPLGVPSIATNYASARKKLRQVFAKSDLSLEDIATIRSAINSVLYWLNPNSGIGLAGASADTWAKIEPMLKHILNGPLKLAERKIRLSLTLESKENDKEIDKEIKSIDSDVTYGDTRPPSNSSNPHTVSGPTNQTSTDLKKPLLDRLHVLKNKLNTYNYYVRNVKNDEVKNWPMDEIKEIEQVEAKITNTHKDALEEFLPGLTAEVEAEEKAVLQFFNTYLNGKKG
jgi:hypothetical protein